MSNFKKVLQALAIIALAVAPSAEASKIQQQGIVTSSDCTTRGISNASCLPLDTQVYVTANGLNETLNAAIAAGSIGGGSSGGGVQLLSNPGFEIGSTGAPPASWTLSSATGTLSTAQIYAGAQSELLTISAQTPVLSQDFTPTQPLTGINLEASCHVLTTLTTAQVCAREAGASLGSSYCVSVPSTGNWQYVPVNFVGPASGSIGVQVTTSASATGTIYVDNCYLGPATNVSQVSQSQLIGTSLWATGLNYWTVTPGTTAYTAFPANASIPAPTLTGVLTQPATRLPEVIIPSAAPGTYYVVANGSFLCSSVSCNAWMSFYDGTSNSVDNMTSYTGGTTGVGSGTVIGTFTYTTPQTNLTFSVQGRVLPASKAIDLGDGSTSGETFGISVYYFPSQAQTANTIQTTAASWSGYHSAASGSFTMTSSGTANTITDFTSGPGTLVLNTRTSNNITCTNNSTTFPSISCTFPKQGRYRIDASTSLADTTTTTSIQTVLTDSSNNVLGGSNYQYNSTTAGFVASSPYGYFNAPSAGTYSFKIRAASNGTSQALSLGSTGAADMIDWSVMAVDQGFPGPILYGTVSSTTSGQEHVERARINTSGCTILSQSGSWISSISGSAGNCTITLTTGEFSATPSCVASVSDSGGAIAAITGPSSSTNLPLLTLNGSGTPQNDTNTSIMCMGPH